MTCICEWPDGCGGSGMIYCKNGWDGKRPVPHCKCQCDGEKPCLGCDECAGEDDGDRAHDLAMEDKVEDR